MNYGRLSGIYHWLERLSFGGALLRARLMHLDRVVPVRRALLVGEGNGSFLLPFVRKFPQAYVTVLDESREMLAVARERLRSAGHSTERVELVEADVMTVAWPQQNYDLVVTAFFFDNFEQDQVDQMVERVCAVTTSDAQWLLTDFQIPVRGWRRWRAQLWMWLLYRFFGQFARVPVRDLPDALGALSRASFTPCRNDELCAGLLRSTLLRKVI